MGRRLDSPLQIGSTATDQLIPRLIIELGLSGTQIDLAKTAITYEVQSFSDTGQVVHGKSKVAFHADWSPQVVAAVKTIIAWAESDAESAGIMRPGTSKTDI